MKTIPLEGMMTTPFGHTLRAMRTGLGLSQLDLAHSLGSTQRHLSFLETGRSRPSLDFVVRLSTELGLSLPQRAALFDSAGFDNPYRRRDFGAERVADLMDMLERRVLRHWPFPGFVMDKEWTILRANAPGRALVEAFLGPGVMDQPDTPPSFCAILMSPMMRAQIENWEEASLIYYFRMQSAGANAPRLAQIFEQARAEGAFDHVPERLASADEVPPFVPVILRGPDGQRLQITSLVGHLAAAHDAAIEGLEIEFMVPMDDDTEARMTGPA